MSYPLMRKKYRLAAIDIDGTLIHGSRQISDANLHAIARMQRDGIEVILASGRHHTSMIQFAAKIPGVHWMVSSQGAEVSDITRSHTLEKTFLTPELARRALALGRNLQYAIVVYADDGVFRLDAPKDITKYAGLDGGLIPYLTDDACLAKNLFKITYTTDKSHMEGIELHPGIASLDATKVRTHHFLYEILPRGITKGSGLARLAAHLGISAAETIAFGDAENDIPMFQWAATSVAMPSPWQAAHTSATMTAPAGPGDTALARGITLALD